MRKKTFRIFYFVAYRITTRGRKYTPSQQG